MTQQQLLLGCNTQVEAIGASSALTGGTVILHLAIECLDAHAYVADLSSPFATRFVRGKGRLFGLHATRDLCPMRCKRLYLLESACAIDADWRMQTEKTPIHRI